jgi:hypothetical protein
MKYSLSAFYQEFIKEKILKSFLAEGKIPTNNEIEEGVNSVLVTSNEFKNPILASVPYFILNGETSSASKTNNTFQAIESDLNICVKAVIDQEDKVSSLYDSSFSKISGLQNKITNLRQDVDRLLFQAKNTMANEELFYEKFQSIDMVDQKLTTASVDVNINEVVLKATEQIPISLSGSVDSFSVIPENNPRIINSTDVGEMVIANIIKNNNKVWMHQLSASEALSSATIDLIIRIPSLQTEINKILLEPFSVDIKTQVNIEVSYSKDGLNWIYPDGEYKKRLDKLTSLTFKGAQHEYWRIRFTKFGNDGFFSNFYVYNYGLKSLNFYGKTYNKVSRLDLGYFYSKPILFKNNIKMANVKVCETLPTSTSIAYSLAPIYQGSLSAITNGTLSPADLYYYPMNFSDVDSFTLDFLSTSTTPVINEILPSTVLTYKDKGYNDFCLDTILPTNYAKSQTIIMRDALDQTLHAAVGQESTFENQYAGWTFDGLYYSTYLLVEDYGGVEIDLGSTQMYINNTKVQGKVQLAQGLNFILTHRDNWKSLDLISLPIETDAIVDQLYPYNHKYLIEGLGPSLYGVSLTTDIAGTDLIDVIDKNKIYSHSSRNCWATKMKEVEFETFTAKEKNELDVFAYKIDNTNQERIVVKSDPDNGLINNETFSIITKLHSAENIKGLIFKAVMETENNTVSPVLTEYMIKIK